MLVKIIFTILSELGHFCANLSRSIFRSHYPHPHLTCCAQYVHNFKLKIAEMAKPLGSLKAVSGRQPNCAAEQSRERNAFWFAANVFLQTSRAEGLDGFASSMCIPVGRPYSTCHRFSFSHSFLKAPPPSHSQKRTQANCQKHTDSNQNILSNVCVCLRLGRRQRRLVRRGLDAAGEHSKRQFKTFFLMRHHLK